MSQWENDEGLKNEEHKNYVYHPPPLRDDKLPLPGKEYKREHREERLRSSEKDSRL